MLKKQEGNQILSTNNKHQKHPKLDKPNLGMYARNELALVGTSCSEIQRLSKWLMSKLSSNFKLAYLDADHASFDNPETHEVIQQGASIYTLNKQESLEIQSSGIPNDYDQKLFYNEIDLVLTNGNHFPAKAQILFVDATKEKSIEKRKEQLNNVIAIVNVDGSYLKSSITDSIASFDRIPQFGVEDLDELYTTVSGYLERSRPKLKALILAGGKSTRMQKDKSQLVYENENQIVRLNRLLDPHVEEVFVSCRSEQDIDTDLPKVVDAYNDFGPLGAILSAFRSDANCAWLVVACDLPLLTDNVINELISNRSTSNIATAFLNDKTGFAEPLIAIWEPKSYLRLLQFIALGYSCPRKVLINSNTHLITPSNPDLLMNVNTPEEYDLAQKKLSS